MAKALTNPTFDYSQLSTDDKGKVTYFEGELLRSRKRVADEIIKHGAILHGVQSVLANYSGGVFVAWLDSVGISTRSAYNAINAYVGFASFANVQNLEVSAMYKLASNEKAKTKALRLADKGVKVTHQMAKQLIEQTSVQSTQAEPDGDTLSTSLEKTASASSPAMDVDAGDTGSGAVTDDGSMEALETFAGTAGDAKDDPCDLGKCPNCAGDKWKHDDDGHHCAKCYHPHGEPAGDVDDDRIATQRSKTVKTCEALLRAFDDLQLLMPHSSYGDAINDTKSALRIAKAWK